MNIPAIYGRDDEKINFKPRPKGQGYGRKICSCPTLSKCLTTEETKKTRILIFSSCDLEDFIYFMILNFTKYRKSFSSDEIQFFCIDKVSKR